MTTGAHDIPNHDPASAEVRPVEEQEQHALERLRTQVRALEVSAEAKGVAGIAMQHATAKAEQLGERIAVLESEGVKRDTVLDKIDSRLDAIDASTKALDDRLEVLGKQSPVQQFIYSTFATLAAVYFGVQLYRMATGAG